jgi:hypothetical protein
MKILLGLSMLLTAGALQAATLIVNDSGDSLHASPGGCAVTGTGTCTLRDAITFANGNPGQDSIAFQSAVSTILVGPGGLPAITEAVAINGDLGAGGRVKVDGTGAGSGDGLTLSGNGSSISSVQIVSFSGAGVRITGDGNTLGHCSGIGCLTGQVRISGNGGHGVLIDGGADNVIGNCRIELNGGDGVRLNGGATGNSIGALEEFPVNDITGNTGAGVGIGDSAADAATTGNRISASWIYANGGLGIDLGSDGVTANDDQDPDPGPNTLQNFPVLTAAESGPGSVTVSGTLNSTPDTMFTIQIFSSAAQDPSGYGEAESILGRFTVTTDAQGDAAFTEVFPVSLPVGTFITATATGSTGTSELSQALATTAPPGMDFFTVPPCRVADTRDAPGPWGGPALISNERREILFAGQCGIPSDARAVSVNVTAVTPTGPGFLRLFPAESEELSSSTLNFNTGQTRANNAIIGLIEGKMWIRPFIDASPGTVHMILDVNGYFR